MTRSERWEQLYKKLTEALSQLGVNDAFGNGDYWLVDDDWGGHHHKLCVTRKDFWSKEVEASIRRVLADSFSDWGVYTVFEESSEETNPGFIVYSDGLSDSRRWE